MTDEHLRRSIRVISTVQYGIGCLLLVAGIVLSIPLRELSVRHAGIFAMVAVAVFLFVLGRSVRRYRPWARSASIVMSVIGIVAFPLGTLICGPFVYVLTKGKHLFTNDLPGSAAIPTGSGTVPLPVQTPVPVEMRRDAA